MLTNPANWPVGPPLALAIVAAVFYAAGVRRRASVRRRVEWRWRAAAFGAGLLAILVALDSPIDAYDTRFFSVHMTQHVLLMLVAPPLIVLGRPWTPIWQRFPLGFRRAVAASWSRARLGGAAARRRPDSSRGRCPPGSWR